MEIAVLRDVSSALADLWLAANPVVAQNAPDLVDLVGARAAGGETQLEARGYEFIEALGHPHALEDRFIHLTTLVIPMARQADIDPMRLAVPHKEVDDMRPGIKVADPKTLSNFVSSKTSHGTLPALRTIQVAPIGVWNCAALSRTRTCR
jgi:hypothetical protein